MKIPPELIQAIKKDNLILFVGAGLSYELKNKNGEELKDWKNLVHQLILHLEGQGFDVDDLKFMSTKGKRAPFHLLQHIESDRDLPKSKMVDFLKEFLDLSPQNNFDLHKKLFQLSRKIITTNYDRAFEKYQKAIEIKPDDHQAFYNWGANLSHLAKSKTGEEAQALYQQAFEKLKTAINLGGPSYNLACLYVLTNDKENALLFLDESLSKQEIATDYVRKDTDWEGLLDDEDFKKLLSKHEG